MSEPESAMVHQPTRQGLRARSRVLLAGISACGAVALVAGVVHPAGAVAHGSVVPGAGPAQTGQSATGAALYQESCASCHGTGLGHGGAPALTGETFWTSWEGKPARQLYRRILSTMPQTEPGSLPPEQVVDIVSYILLENHQAIPPEGFKDVAQLDAVIIRKVNP